MDMMDDEFAAPFADTIALMGLIICLIAMGL
jgi:hypothetical protein